MLSRELKDRVVSRILPGVTTPAQYIGGELNSIAKDHSTVRGTVCLAFPDTYSLGMSHHGLQVLYSLMNASGWACERTFTPLPDFEAALARSPKAKAVLDAFAPSAQRDYLEWIAEAKQDATREKRIATAIEWLSEGKKRHWKYEKC